MPPVLRAFLVPAALALAAASAHGADASGAGCRRTLDEALRNHAMAAQSLNRSRGIARPAEALPDLSSLARHADSVLLLFDLEEATICGHVVTLGASGAKPALRYAVGTRQDLDRMVDAFRASLDLDALQGARSPSLARGIVPARSTRKAPPPAEAIGALSRALFPPEVARLLEGRKQLLVVPVLSMGTVPFAALEPAGWQAPLIEHMPYVILPNLYEGSLRRLADAAWGGLGGDKALVIGDPDLSRHADWRFPPLPGADKEARYVAGKVPGWSYLGLQATKGSLLQKHRDANLIYIASHGIADPRNPLDGGFIALSDALLTPREIQSLDLGHQPLVVLSACQTGLGMAHEGGTIGLARAFQLAGAFGVAMSLWNVDDDATFTLMTRFVDELARRTPADALRIAMLEARRQYKSPALWASFSYFGMPLRDGTKP